VSRPPEYPGSQRLKRAATRSKGGAYEGAFEAVGSILIATGLGYWFDQHYETTPVGVVVGACVGFGAFVLRLVRLGRQIHPDSMDGERDTAGMGDGSGGQLDGKSGEERFVGEGLGLSDVLDEPEDETRTNDER
jgi:F0F1-type ATP synthase assembly protein I